MLIATPINIVNGNDTRKRFSLANLKISIVFLWWPSISGNSSQIPARPITLMRRSHTFTNAYPNVMPIWVDIDNPNMDPAETPRTILFTLSWSSSPITVRAIMIADE